MTTERSVTMADLDDLRRDVGEMALTIARIALTFRIEAANATLPVINGIGLIATRLAREPLLSLLPGEDGD